MSPIHISGPITPTAALVGEPPFEETVCCMGAAMGRERCTCWEAVYDLKQQPLADGGLVPDVIPTRSKCCHDCAYRNGSPEREGDVFLPRDDAREFWCHDGVRRAVAYRHSVTGREVPSGAGDYQPPVGPAERPVVWKADGTIGERCAGWAAHTAGRGASMSRGSSDA